MEAVRAVGVSKYFPSNGVMALDGVTLGVERGEILAVVGENGAGKSTLMLLLAGYLNPTAGQIEVGGEKAAFRSPADALASGIAIVHQTPRLVGGLTVLENCLLGAETASRTGFLETRRVAATVRDLNERYGFGLDIRRNADGLSLSERQKAALLAVVFRSPRVIILDEPTAALAPQEIERLFAFARSYAAEGGSCVVITHRLPEAMGLAGRIAVLRRGRLVASVASSSVSAEALAHLMVGSLPTELPAFAPSGEERAYSAESVSLRRGGRRLLSNISFSLRQGEVLGFVGMREDGLEALESVVFGMEHPTGGAMRLGGEDVTAVGPGGLRARGARYVPARKLERGISLKSSVSDNLVIDRYKTMARCGVLDLKSMADYARRLAGYFKLNADVRQDAHRCSGGMLQKIVLSRELSDVPSFLVLAQPGNGLDVASRYRVNRRILELRNTGTAILLFSTDLDEALALSDRVAALYAGSIARIFTRAELNALGPEAARHRLGEAMLGLNRTGERLP